MASHFTIRPRRPLVLPVIVAALAWASGAPALRAELTWKQTTVETAEVPQDGVVEARFRFSNDGTTPVDIDQIQTSCGCTTVELKQRHYEPGQGGEIVAHYTVGDHLGLQTKTVLVSTGEHAETELKIVVHLPEVLRIEPAFVVWKPGEDRTPKTIQLTAAPENLTLDDVSVQASNSRVAAVLRPVAKGRRYEIQLTPDVAGQPALVTLLIRARLGSKEYPFRAYATIARSASPSPAPDSTPSE